MPFRAPVHVLWVELPPVRRDMFLQKYILHLHILLLKTKKHLWKNIYFAWAGEDNLHETNKCYWIFYSLEQVWFSLLSLSESASIFLFLTTCFFGGMMTNFDINVFIIESAGHLKVSGWPLTTPAGRPGDYRIRRWCANRWNRRMSVLFVTIA